MRKILLSGIFGDHLPVTPQVSNNVVPITYLQKRSFLKKKKQSVREMERETKTCEIGIHRGKRQTTKN